MFQTNVTGLIAMTQAILPLFLARPDGGRSRGAGGAGLGLAIVQAIAAAHGGTATAANNPGGGAVISLHLPGAASPC